MTDITTITLADILSDRRTNFEANGGYRQNAAPEVYSYYKAYVATGQYPYLRSVVAYIREREVVPEDLARYLETETYLASGQYRAERAAEHRQQMLSDGWKDLTTTNLKAETTTHIEVDGTIENDLFTHKVASIFKFVIVEGCAYLMKPRARSKGIPVGRIDNAFYKVVGT